MKKAFAITLLLTGLVAFAQAPAVDCPVHHQPSLWTGHSKRIESGMSSYNIYEYCHPIQNQADHCFWART